MQPDGGRNGVPEIHIDFEAITRLFAAAHEEGRNYLFEHETYELLHRSGAETPPRTRLLAKATKPSNEELSAIPGDKVVLKIVSPTIVHKTEVGGIRVIENTPDRIRSNWRRMMYEVPERYIANLDRHPLHAADAYKGLSGEALRQAVSRDIRGVLLVEFMPPDSEAFGNELFVGIRNTREFGMVISAGLGGTDTELYARCFKKGQAVVAASAELTGGHGFFELFRKTISYRKLAGLTREQHRIVTDEQLIECFSSFIAMARHYSPLNSKAPFVIEELEINPFAFTDYLMVPLDGMCRFSEPRPLPVPRPYKKIGNLLHPETIGIVGVSTSRVNYGRIILRNILAQGFPSENVRLIKGEMDAFEGIKCVPDPASVDVKLDLFIIAVASDRVPDLVDQIIEHQTAEAAMLIAGGMGETRESRERAAQMMASINKAHLRNDGGPVFLGANCLGVISHPGQYDTLFIPEAKLPRQREVKKGRAAFISQSGAFMITRLSKRPDLNPSYMISVGNQNDLTLGDMVSYLKDDADLDVIAVYAEGFKDLDGLAASRAVRNAVLAGKDVIFYKAGRTPEGRSATSGHTATLAGDYMVCESCVTQAGGIVAETFSQFEDLLMLSQRLHGKRINGNRLAAVSGAGFEAVCIADNIQSETFAMQMAAFGPDAAGKLRQMLVEKGLDRLVEVKNPLDINPAADDEAHVRAVQYLAEDSGVDAVVVGLDPLSPAMRTLAESDSQQYDMDNEASIAFQMPKLIAKLDKPVIGVVDGGDIFDPLIDRLVRSGMAVFTSSDAAVQTLALYIQGRLYAERLRTQAE